jgi:hypothetical protein
LKGGGAARARDLSVERELDAFIQRRHEKRRQTEGEREGEMLWKASERRHRAVLRERNRWEWVRHFDRLARSLRERADHYERWAETLMRDETKGDTT